MDDSKRVISLVLLVAAAAALAMAASASIPTGGPFIDAESTNTTTTSDLTNKSTVTYNATTNSTLSFNITNADGSNMEVKVLQNGTLLETFDNASSEMSFDGNFSDGSSNYANYYNLTLGDDGDGYTGVVADAGENVTLTYRIIDDTSVSSPGKKNVTVYWQNDDNQSFARYESGDVETSELGTLPSFAANIPVFGGNISNGPAQAEAEGIGVNNDEQEQITLHVADADAQDALAETHSLALDNGISWMGTASVNGTAVPIVASGEDGAEWLETDNETYVSVNDAGDEVVVHNAGDVLGDSQSAATVKIVGAENAGFTYARSLAGDYGAGFLQANGAGLAAGVDWNDEPDFGEA